MPNGIGRAVSAWQVVPGTVHRTLAVAEKNDWQFSNPRIDTVSKPSQTGGDYCLCNQVSTVIK